MKLQSMTFKNKKRNIIIENVEFTDLTLFVGASGVGKTQILRAIANLRRICKNTFSGSVEWDVVLVDGDKKIRWTGETQDSSDGNSANFFLSTEDDIENEKNEVFYVNEEIYINDYKLITRTSEEIIFKGNSIPKLSNTSSLVYLLKEKEIQDIESFFKKILQEDTRFYSFVSDSISVTKDELMELDMRLFDKLCITHDGFQTLFNEIKDDFISIFPFVEDIKIDYLKNEKLPIRTVIIKEKNVDVEITYEQLSSGMKKSLVLLSTIHLAPKGSILIVDELENCLGINCLDNIVEILQDNDRDIQAIFTSHHPYIINTIPREHWRLVTRDGGAIHSEAVAEKMSTISKHEAFIQLMQLDSFRDGIRS